ncbi:MAG TPA: hypothetical protein VME67_03440 [Mycobacterium sp.]|nr:hypothetical protein [Mycobacterium sp.]HTX93959.1 hypothetical protein [Mycobacterium sp.]
METSTIDPRRWRIARIFSRNPLLRRADRIEALVVLVALVASLIAIPVAGVVGVLTYGARARVYTQEAHERHRVMATVAETWVQDFGMAVVQAKWPAASGEHTGVLQFTDQVKVGDSVEIWVDGDGNPVVPPTPAWLAVAEAIGVAAMTLLVACGGLATMVAAARSRLDRARDAGWERDLRCLAGAS